MKSLIIIINFLLFSSIAFCQEKASGLAGDNLDLNAVMELFKKSETVEEFENELNSEKNNVNNLDLNDDGFVDYIRVIDYSEGDAHSLTLQVPYSDKEAQDVAVIEIEKDGDNTIAQIVGDEELYGKDYIVEPNSEDNSSAANVSDWKPVRHIYSPRYVIWVSPWRHGYYPKIYRPWKPVGWGVYRGWNHHHHQHYRRAHTYRCHRAHGHYHKHKVHSVTFHNHHKAHQKAKNKASNIHKAKLPPKSKSGNANQHKVAQPNKSSQGGGGATKKRDMSSPAPSSTKGKPTKRPGATKTQSGGAKKSGSGGKTRGGGH